MIRLNPKTTALVIIDLQKGILGRELFPRSAADVLATTKSTAVRFREAGAKIVWVTVGWADDFSDSLKAPVDEPMSLPTGGLPPGFADLAEGLAAPGDLYVRKRQWGAFYGTDLDLVLRRRGIETIALGGVATNFGVESTARDARERGYAVVLLEDACATMSAELHDLAIRSILPRIARVRKVAEVELGG
jgi:nicotinamidase-related amidase